MRGLRGRGGLLLGKGGLWLLDSLRRECRMARLLRAFLKMVRFIRASSGVALNRETASITSTIGLSTKAPSMLGTCTVMAGWSITTAASSSVHSTKARNNKDNSAQSTVTLTSISQTKIPHVKDIMNGMMASFTLVTLKIIFFMELERFIMWMEGLFRVFGRRAII